MTRSRDDAALMIFMFLMIKRGMTWSSASIERPPRSAIQSWATRVYPSVAQPQSERGKASSISCYSDHICIERSQRVTSISAGSLEPKIPYGP
jgi:hypothetical protein